MCDKWNQNIIKNIAIKKYVIKSKIVKRLTKLILKKLMTFEGFTFSIRVRLKFNQQWPIMFLSGYNWSERLAQHCVFEWLSFCT